MEGAPYSLKHCCFFSYITEVSVISHHDCVFSSTSQVTTPTLRATRLNTVRQLFLKCFRSSIPETGSEGSPAGGPLAGLTGFLTKLASSVINTNS